MAYPENSPSEFSIILGTFPSITATAEFVVPRKYQQAINRLLLVIPYLNQCR